MGATSPNRADPKPYLDRCREHCLIEYAKKNRQLADSANEMVAPHRPLRVAYRVAARDHLVKLLEDDFSNLEKFVKELTSLIDGESFAAKSYERSPAKLTSRHPSEGAVAAKPKSKASTGKAQRKRIEFSKQEDAALLAGVQAANDKKEGMIWSCFFCWLTL